jgi:hypothetical protein
MLLRAGNRRRVSIRASLERVGQACISVRRRFACAFAAAGAKSLRRIR